MNLAPQPLLDTQIAYTMARVIMAGAKLGVYEALKDGPATVAHVAKRCRTDELATEKLLFAIAGCGYLKQRGETYELTAVSRKWLISDSRHSLVDKLAFQVLEWDFLGQSEEYIRTGKPLDMHAPGRFSPDDWDVYQRGMRAMANAFAPEAVKRIPVPKGATRMLDIGGSHGYYSVGLCRKHPGLSSQILDLPEAVEQAAPILAAENMGDTVTHWAGDALTDDLGTEQYDLVLVAQLIHHFTPEQNREVTQRIAAALKPGGVFAIMDEFRPGSVKSAGQMGALLEFYFALTSQSGSYAIEEITDWQTAAGLKPMKEIKLVTAPGVGIQAAVKPR
jgi:SAM-dependent methyltransferase